MNIDFAIFFFSRLHTQNAASNSTPLPHWVLICVRMEKIEYPHKHSLKELKSVKLT